LDGEALPKKENSMNETEKNYQASPGEAGNGMETTAMPSQVAAPEYYFKEVFWRRGSRSINRWGKRFISSGPN
jgi:hypothetical protein